MESRTMKDSGVEWIAEIPKDWEVVALKHIATLNDDSLSMGTPGDYEFNYIDIGSVSFEEGIHSRELTTFEQAPSRARRLVRRDDIIISTVRTYLKAIAIIPDEENVVVSTGFAVVRSVDVLPLFLSYAVRSDYYTEKVSALSYGVAYPSINASELMSIKVAIPKINEQQKIASFLDEKVAHIDSILEDTKKSIEDLKAYKQSLITETVTKGLNPNVEMKDSGVEWIGEIPKHWVLSKIKYRVSLRSEKELYQIGDKYIGLEHIESNNGRIHSYDEDYSGELTDRFKSGDVLFSKLRPYLAKGFIASFDGYCSGELLTFKDVEGDKRYLLYYILSENFIDAINASTYGTKMPRANWDYIKELPIPCFPIYEQQVIAGFLDEKTSHIDSLIRNKKKMLQEIEAYKKSLIYEYVTGKKEVK